LHAASKRANRMSDDDANPQRKGGKARALRLTPEERREIARQGGLARSARYQAPNPENIPWAVAEGTLTIGDATIPCAVLENGKRVLTQQGVLLALGRARAARGGEGASVDEGAAFLRAKNLKPFISNELELSTKPCVYKPKLGGYTPHKGWLAIAYGHDAEAFPAILEVYVKARDAGVLHWQQRHVAELAETLLKALPKIAMVALVDEATGYQAVRAHDELQAILAAYILPEHRPWVKTVPVEFTKELYRVYGWNYSPDNRGPRYASKLIRKLLYEQMPPPVLPELDRINPANKTTWQRKGRHHSYLTLETGLEHFKGQLSGTMALLRATPDNDRRMFLRLFDRAYGKQKRLDLGDEDSDIQ
jgi:hypothetical protein